MYFKLLLSILVIVFATSTSFQDMTTINDNEKIIRKQRNLEISTSGLIRYLDIETIHAKHGYYILFFTNCV